MPVETKFLLRNGRFAVGKDADIRALVGKETQTFDARQMTIVPGFIECHNHAPGNTLLYEVVVGHPYVVEFVMISSIVDKLRGKARETPPGTWVEGYFFDDTKVKERGIGDVCRVGERQFAPRSRGIAGDERARRRVSIQARGVPDIKDDK